MAPLCINYVLIPMKHPHRLPRYFMDHISFEKETGGNGIKLTNRCIYLTPG